MFKMSDQELFTDSEPDFLSPVGSQSPVVELRTSSGSDIESELESGESRRLTTADVMVKAFSNKTAARCLGKKRPSQQDKDVCHERKRSKSGASSSLRNWPAGAAIASGLSSDPLGTEVKSALKEITSLLNTVVERVERVEDELQRQRSTGPSSSSDSTPTRVKPSLAVKVS